MSKQSKEQKWSPFVAMTENMCERIQLAIETGETLPWHRPWESGQHRPRNLEGRLYNGLNIITLSFAGNESPFWGTYKQVTSKGGKIRKGAKSMPVWYWKTYEREATEKNPSEVGFVCKYFRVFNGADMEGIELPELEQPLMPGAEPDERGEAIVKGYANAPGIHHDSNRAYYAPGTDKVHMPKMDRFRSTADYYSVLFHELAHSTGHESRLNRADMDNAATFGDEAYSREELTAELAACILRNVAGLDTPSTADNSAAYLRGWMKHLKDNPRWLMYAGTRAAKAAAFILGELEAGAKGNAPAKAPKAKKTAAKKTTSRRRAA